jgi:hypothetical protein
MNVIFQKEISHFFSNLSCVSVLQGLMQQKMRKWMSPVWTPLPPSVAGELPGRLGGTFLLFLVEHCLVPLAVCLTHFLISRKRELLCCTRNAM